MNKQKVCKMAETTATVVPRACPAHAPGECPTAGDAETIDTPGDELAAKIVDHVYDAIGYKDRAELVDDVRAAVAAAREEARREADQAARKETRDYYEAKIADLFAQRTAGGDADRKHDACRIIENNLLVHIRQLESDIAALAQRPPADSAAVPGADARTWATDGGLRCLNCGKGLSAHEYQRNCQPVAEAAAQADGARHEALEREHLGDPDKGTGIYAAPTAQPTPPDDEQAALWLKDADLWRMWHEVQAEHPRSNDAIRRFAGKIIVATIEDGIRRAALRQPGALPDDAEDAARLDFMTTDKCIIDSATNADGTLCYWLSWPYLYEEQPQVFSTPRAAIDAALAARQAGGEEPCAN